MHLLLRCHSSKFDICALLVFVLGQESPNVFVKVHVIPLS